MIHILTNPATAEQIRDMLEEYETVIKIVADIRRGILAGGGHMHADCEEALLEQGSEQDDLWGANWYVEDRRIAFESLINIRPLLGNRSVTIQSASIREQVENVVQRIFGGV